MQPAVPVIINQPLEVEIQCDPNPPNQPEPDQPDPAPLDIHDGVQLDQDNVVPVQPRQSTRHAKPNKWFDKDTWVLSDSCLSSDSDHSE